MVLMPIDSVQTLEEAELPPGAARAIVRVINRHVTAAVSGLATKEDLEACRAAIAESRAATKHDIAEFQAATKHDIAESRAATKQDLVEFRAATKHDFDEFRVYIHHQWLKWSMALFAALLSSYASLIFLVIQHLKK